MRGEIVKCDQCGTMEMYGGAHELYRVTTPFTELQTVGAMRRDGTVLEFCSADCLNMWSYRHKESLAKTNEG